MAVMRFNGIGTAWEIETDLPLSPGTRQAVLALVEGYDATWSRFRADSLIAQVAAAQSGGAFRFPAEGPALFDLYDRLHIATDGAVDPLIGEDLERMGYDAAYSLVPASGMEDRPCRSWSSDVARDGTRIVTREPVLIDVGAAGKGQLVDLVAGLLLDNGVKSFVVDASGDMIHVGDVPLTVGLEHPRDPSRVVGLVQLRGRALCASASNRRVWGDHLHHIIDARTGVPAHSVVATWVIADDAMMADGLATALFFVPLDRLAAVAPFTCARMMADGTLDASPNFAGEIFA